MNGRDSYSFTVKLKTSLRTGGGRCRNETGEQLLQDLGTLLNEKAGCRQGPVQLSALEAPPTQIFLGLGAGMSLYSPHWRKGPNKEKNRK